MHYYNTTDKASKIIRERENKQLDFTNWVHQRSNLNCQSKVNYDGRLRINWICCCADKIETPIGKAKSHHAIKLFIGPLTEKASKRKRERMPLPGSVIVCMWSPQMAGSLMESHLLRFRLLACFSPPQHRQTQTLTTRFSVANWWRPLIAIVYEMLAFLPTLSLIHSGWLICPTVRSTSAAAAAAAWEASAREYTAKCHAERRWQQAAAAAVVVVEVEFAWCKRKWGVGQLL